MSEEQYAAYLKEIEMRHHEKIVRSYNKPRRSRIPTLSPLQGFILGVAISIPLWIVMIGITTYALAD